MPPSLPMNWSRPRRRASSPRPPRPGTRPQSASYTTITLPGLGPRNRVPCSSDRACGPYPGVRARKLEWFREVPPGGGGALPPRAIRAAPARVPGMEPVGGGVAAQGRGGRAAGDGEAAARAGDRQRRILAAGAARPRRGSSCPAMRRWRAPRSRPISSVKISSAAMASSICTAAGAAPSGPSSSPRAAPGSSRPGPCSAGCATAAARLGEQPVAAPP